MQQIFSVWKIVILSIHRSERSQSSHPLLNRADLHAISDQAVALDRFGDVMKCRRLMSADIIRRTLPSGASQHENNRASVIG
jgi:hypothetical protein